MTIRIMTIADYDAVRSLWSSTPGMGLNSLDDAREGISKYLSRNPGTCFVAEDAGRIVGAILTGHDGRRGFIYHAAVAVSHRNQGIGTALTDAAVSALKNEGITKAALVVFEKNALGSAFWENRGFTLRKDLRYRDKALAETERIDI